MTRPPLVLACLLLVLAGCFGGADGPTLDAVSPGSRTLTLQGLYPRDLPLFGTAGADLADRVFGMSGGRVAMRYLDPDAEGAVRRSLEAVADGRLDAVWGTPAYWADRDPALLLFGGAPFGPDPATHDAWMDEGGGRAMLDSIYGGLGLKSVPCGYLGPEAFGYFRRPLNGPDDLRGLRMRFFGPGSEVMRRLGVEVTTPTRFELYAGVASGALDAAAFSQPYIDEPLGLEAVLPYYYYPGWHTPFVMLEVVMRTDTWRLLPDAGREAIVAACAETAERVAREDARLRRAALAALTSRGARVLPTPPAVEARLRAAWEAVAAETARRDPAFRRAHASLRAFGAARRRASGRTPPTG